MNATAQQRMGVTRRQHRRSQEYSRRPRLYILDPIRYWTGSGHSEINSCASRTVFINFIL
jgi:hypothetical protein